MPNVFQPQNSSIMRISIKNIPFYLLCLTIPFENTSLASIGGVFTAPLSFLLVPFFLTYIIYKAKSLNKSSFFIIKYIFFMIIYSLAVLFFYIDEYDMYFLVDRGIRFLLLTIPLITVFIIGSMQTEEVMKKGIYITFSVVMLSFFINLLVPDLINNTSFIQYSSALSVDRMRGFTLEASNFGFQFVLIFLMFLAAKKLNNLIFIPIIILTCLLITSKGSIIGFMVAIGITFAFFSKTHPAFKIILAFIFSILIFYFLQLTLEDTITRDIEKYNSIATRSTVILTSLITLVTNPFGAGFFGYLPSIYENGHTAMDIMNSLFPGDLNFSEFTQYLIVGQTDGVSTKSFFFDWLIYGGLVFLYFYIKFVFRLLKVFIITNSKLEFTVLIFLMLSTMFFISIETRYIAALALSFLYLRYNSLAKDHQKNA
ncbi:hypothetical protein [Thiomicrorhabdus sp.]|uniref:hypothetical protein n=1 Tax=Thiomicrorhabdus sp. TaxID=2039724 RepID=UPI002AA82EB3|nr:hypothetical protein [Thiomicrorhabdus sp.]